MASISHALAQPSSKRLWRRTPTRAEFRSARERALDWVVAHLDDFDPFANGRAFEVRYGQRVTELATMLYCHRILGRRRRDPRLAGITDFLTGIQRLPAFRDRLMRSPAEFVLFADVCAVLAAVGKRDDDLRELVQRVIDVGFLDALERVPHRLMDVRMTLSWGRFRHGWPPQKRLASASILGKPLVALYLDEASIYAITHVILFYYDFGTARPVRPLPNAPALRQLLSLLLVSVCQERQWDLVAELLLCWDCVGGGARDVRERAWRTFLQQQRADGAFPGPDRNLRRPESPAAAAEFGTPREAYVDHHYHTTLVAVIALGRRLISGRHHPQIKATRVRHRPVNATCDAPRAQRWLAALTPLALERRDASSLLRIAIGSWVLSEISPATRRDFDATATALGRALASLDHGRARSRPESSITLGLLGGAVLQAAGHRLRFVEPLIQEVTQALADRSPRATVDHRLFEKQLLLHALGSIRAPRGPAASSVRQAIADFRLGSGADAVDALLLTLNAWSSYGCERRQSPPVADVGDLLDGLLTHYLRAYDIERGCRILRSMAYLGSDTGPMRDAADFLRVHQRPDGGFGFHGPEEQRLRQDLGAGFCAELDLALPTTLGCVLAIAETSGNWRLYEQTGTLRTRTIPI